MITVDETLGIVYKNGVETGWTTKNGYQQFSYKSKKYYTHRYIWWYCFGEWPEADIDHIDGNRLNNKISNLRLATRSENLQNKTTKNKGTSLFKGVYFDKSRNKWSVRCGPRGYPNFQGRYDCEKEAALAYNHAAEMLYGKFASFNKVFEDHAE